ncbi:DUF928 domain-containing protein [Pseudanabaena sp. PCC 6802]|uniref:DUF928 domain-containing protein n=1 Tax=Pseudanabaena sp. PCC 6802 TaxID=118173 RepID=UPI000345888D|nr:DUF928 domain-containing protein [Pseudanabaena sp. PCC 6802]
MFALRYSLQTRSAIAIATACLTATMALVTNDMALAQNRRSKYGLGSLPESGKTSGGTRPVHGELPKIIFLAPDDGALTLSAQPTFYWFIASIPRDTAITNTSFSSNSAIEAITFDQEFMLRKDPHKTPIKGVGAAKTIFNASATSTKTGLYRYTLPITAPELEFGKDRGWRIQVPPDLVQLPDVVVRMENKPAAIAELSKAKTDLEKARIYERYGYWYDAFDAYTKWLEVNPHDKVARRERANMIEVGLKDNRDFRGDGQPNLKLLSELQAKIDASVATDLAPHTVENRP